MNRGLKCYARQEQLWADIKESFLRNTSVTELVLTATKTGADGLASTRTVAFDKRGVLPKDLAQLIWAMFGGSVPMDDSDSFEITQSNGEDREPIRITLRVPDQDMAHLGSSATTLSETAEQLRCRGSDRESAISASFVSLSTMGESFETAMGECADEMESARSTLTNTSADSTSAKLCACIDIM